MIVSLPTVGKANTIGQWQSNNSFWSGYGNFSNVFAGSMAAPVNATYELPEAITAANLANNTSMIIRTQNGLSGADSLPSLVNWVRGGGILMLFADSALPQGAMNANTILSALGSSISVSSSTTGNPSFQTLGQFTGADVTNGLLGRNLAFDLSRVVTGGVQLVQTGAPGFDAGSSLRMQNVNLGKVYVFGGSIDANANTLNPLGSNRDFFMALLSQPNGGMFGVDPPAGASGNPEPATFGLTALAIGGLAFWHRRRSSR